MAASPSSPRPGRWLLLQAQLPPGRSTARVAAWRRLRRMGAIALGAVWVVADEAENREACEWLRRELEEAGGEAMLFVGAPVDAAAASALERRQGGERPAGRRATAAALTPLSPAQRARFARRTWVTRPRPGVDRMASAWLVRRFIDPRAKFAFAVDPLAHPGGRGRAVPVPFDAYGAEFGHQQGLCTFEVLARRFGIADPAVRRLGRTVRAVDLDETAPGDAEAEMVERLVAGLRAAHADDGALLEAGIALFEALYRAPAASAPTHPARRKPAAVRRGRGKGETR